MYVIGYCNYNYIIYSEYKFYEDILFVDIKNHYFNVTNIFLESINWINSKYNYDYLIKWDDDIIVNIPLLIIFSNLQKHLLHYCGYLYNRTRICREKNRICFVPYNIYNRSHIPPFVASGLLILDRITSLRIDHFHRIYKSYLIRDDQYIGIICEKLAIKPLPINKYYIRKCIDDGIFDMKYILAYHTNNYNDLNNMSQYI